MVTNGVILTADEMREVEREAMVSGRVSGLDLMEAAGQGVVSAVMSEWPGFAEAPGQAVVLSGPGNNGGDGYVIARLLRDQGWDVLVFAYGDPDRLPPDARINFERWLAGGGEVAASADRTNPEDWATDIQETMRLRPQALVIDALFGIGAERVLPDPLARLASHFSGPGRSGRWVAVDLPSGLHADSGAILGGDPGAAMEFGRDGRTTDALGCFGADLTVTFHARKPAHVLGDGPLVCGKQVVVPLPGVQTPGRVSTLIGAPRRARLEKYAHQHKYSHGHALVVTGGAGSTGATRLAAHAALRIGAGLVTLGAPGAALLEARHQVTSVMTTRIEDEVDLQDRVKDLRIKAMCIGPALGFDNRAARILKYGLPLGIPTVLDADALTLISQSGGLFGSLTARHVLTPHMGEFARLFPDLHRQLGQGLPGGGSYSKIEAVRDAAQRAGAVVLLKGADTVIADPTGRTAVHDGTRAHAAPWLATAGAGDVLAGVICGLMARGLTPYDAAQSGTWLHAEAARGFGPGLIAEDLPGQIPKVLAALP